jgi:hypothetical protein
VTESPERVELRHSCAICGEAAALPAAGGMQLSVIGATSRVHGWAVHPACLQSVLSPMARASYERSLVD